MSNNRHSHPVHNEKHWSCVMLSKLVSEEIDNLHFLGVHCKNCIESVDRIIFFHHKMCNTILLAQLYWKSNKSSPLPWLPHFCSCSLFKTKINSWSSSSLLKATFTKHAKTCFYEYFAFSILSHISRKFVSYQHLNANWGNYIFHLKKTIENSSTMEQILQKQKSYHNSCFPTQ